MQPVTRIQVPQQAHYKIPGHIAQVPTDVLRMIFFYFDEQSLLRLTPTCKHWRRIINPEKIKAEYAEKNVRNCKKMVKAFFKRFDIKINPTLKQVKGKKQPKEILEYLQELFMTAFNLKSKNHRWRIIEFTANGYGYNGIFYSFLDMTPSDTIEQKLLSDFLIPIYTRIFKEATYNDIITKNVTAHSNFSLTLPFFNAMLKALRTAENFRALEFNFGIINVKCIEDLPQLNPLLSTNKHLRHIAFSGGKIMNVRKKFLREDCPDWMAGKGLGFVEKTLSTMPKLEVLTFGELKTKIDIINAKVVANIVKSRCANKNITKIDSLHFRTNSITPNGILTLLDELKNYPFPLDIIFSRRHNFHDDDKLEYLDDLYKMLIVHGLKPNEWKNLRIGLVEADCYAPYSIYGKRIALLDKKSGHLSFISQTKFNVYVYK